MPLYTYIVTYRSRSHVAQTRRSNFKGFIDWTEVVPDLGPNRKQELSDGAYRAEFEAVPNRRHVWRASLSLGGHDLTVHVVQTDE